MNISEKQFKAGINTLYKDCLGPNPNFKNIISKAVGLGMAYQEEKIKEGIDIVFNEFPPVIIWEHFNISIF